MFIHPHPSILGWKFLSSRTSELQLPADFGLLGYFSGHSPLWGDVRHDSRGQTLEQTLNDYNLCLLRTCEQTNVHTDRHLSHHSFSVSYVYVCDPSLTPEFDWQTHNDVCGSDYENSSHRRWSLNWTLGTECPSAPWVCHGCLTSWSYLVIQSLSLLIFWLKLQRKSFKNPTFLKINSPGYPG